MEKHASMDLRNFRKALVCLGMAVCFTTFSYASGEVNTFLSDENMENPPISYGREQTKEKLIQGFVRDKKGEPIIGANIQVKGKSVGVITDMDGLYQMKVPENSVLVVTYIGYKAQEVNVGKSTTVNVTLEETVGGSSGYGFWY